MFWVSIEETLLLLTEAELSSPTRLSCSPPTCDVFTGSAEKASDLSPNFHDKLGSLCVLDVVTTAAANSSKFIHLKILAQWSI